MAHELTHAEASELLGVYALDALDADEREAVDRHLAGCDFCRAEVMEHVEVAGLLSSGIAGAPLSVWDRIAGELVESPPPLDLATIHALRPPPVPPAPDAPALSPPPPTPPPTPIPHRRHRRTGRPGSSSPSSRRGAGIRIGALVAAASVAASVIGVLGLKVVEDGRRIDEIVGGSHGSQLARTIDAAKDDPRAVKVELRSPDGNLFADAWVLPDGRGYLASNNLPPLDTDRNYQMWAVVGDRKISVGLLGSEPAPAAFVASGPVAALAITDEVAGGVVASLQQPVVVGEFRRS